MKIEKLSKVKSKKIVLSITILLFIIGIIYITNSKAKYQVTKNVQIVNGNVSYSPYDFKIMAMYKEENGEEIPITEMPGSDYKIDEDKSYCMRGNERITGLLKTIDGYHTISNLHTNDKCYLWFNEAKTIGEQLLASRTINTGSSGFTSIDTTEHKDSNGKSILYSDTDDFGTTYYFRGKVKDNWVKFGKASGKDIWWRIIRINGNGSIRMIYTGTGDSAPTNDGYLNNNVASSQLQTNAYNVSPNDNAYIGYMYGGTGKNNYNDTHANNTDSDIKKILDSWYSTNLKTEYGKYIDKDAGYCNDRKVATMNRSGYGTNGWGTQQTAYAAADRLLDTSWNTNTRHTPTFKCVQQNDIFTLPDAKKPDGSDYGNHKLKDQNGTGENSPIGLITIDEVVFAGGYNFRSNNQSDNKQFYLYTGQTYWTMSPFRFSSDNATIFFVTLDGIIMGNPASSSCGVRPVINLKADAKLSGDGTHTNPYTVS